MAGSWVGAGPGLPKIDSMLRELMELVVPTKRPKSLKCRLKMLKIARNRSKMLGNGIIARLRADGDVSDRGSEAEEDRRLMLGGSIFNNYSNP